MVDRVTVPDARGERQLVLLELHPGAAAVAQLAALQILLDLLSEERDASGQTLHNGDEFGAVRFAGRHDTEHRLHLPMRSRHAAPRPRRARGQRGPLSALRIASSTALLALERLAALPRHEDAHLQHGLVQQHAEPGDDVCLPAARECGRPRVVGHVEQRASRARKADEVLGRQLRPAGERRDRDIGGAGDRVECRGVDADSCPLPQLDERRRALGTACDHLHPACA